MFQGVAFIGEEMTLCLQTDALDPDAEAVAAAPPAKIERRKSQSEGTAAQTLGKGSIVLFPLLNSGAGGERLLAGLSVRQVCEVTESLPIVKVPRAPDFVLGLVNWRGRAVPVLDLGRRLGLPALGPASSERLIIARGTSVTDLCGIPASANVWGERLPIFHKPKPEHDVVEISFAKGLFEVSEGQTLVIPDIDRALTA